MVHSNINFAGQSLPDGKAYLCCVVKDNLLRGFYIRVVDPEVSMV